VNAGNADADGDAPFAAATAEPDSGLEAMAGELTSKLTSVLGGADSCYGSVLACMACGSSLTHYLALLLLSLDGHVREWQQVTRTCNR
jgi:hypothetical protein